MILGQRTSIANALLDLAYIPYNKQGRRVNVEVTNDTDQIASYTITTAISGAAPSTTQYTCAGKLKPGFSEDIGLGLPLSRQDVVRFYCDTDGVSFNAFGDIIDQNIIPIQE